MNILAIVVATISNFILGGIWYSLLFGNLWVKESHMNIDDIKCHSTMPYLISLICSLLAAVGFNYLTTSSLSLEQNLITGLIAGILLVATSMATNYAFANKSMKLFLIDAGYHVAQFILYALIFWYV